MGRAVWVGDGGAGGFRVAFARDTDAPRLFSTVTNGNDVQHEQLFRLVCFFLKTHWPLGKQPKPS